MLSLHHISPTSTYSFTEKRGGMSTNEGREGKRGGGNQLVGSMLDRVKKVAVVGSPMPSM